jgi:hypothetical protein
VAHPMVGNLAWAPLPAFEEVETLDRFNGVPTLGVFGRPGERALFWRALGYVPKREMSVSIWIYVPLDEADERRLEPDDASDLLNGLIFQSEAPRAVTVGIARDYRLLFEYEWVLPAGLSPNELLHEMIHFAAESLNETLKQVAPARRKDAQRASKAVRQLVAAS